MNPKTLVSGIPNKVTVLGLELDRWVEGSCIADFGVGKNWATLYFIQSGEPGKGHATNLLLTAKKYYEDRGKNVSGSIALNERMAGVYKKVGIKENK